MQKIPNMQKGFGFPKIGIEKEALSQSNQKKFNQVQMKIKYSNKK